MPGVHNSIHPTIYSVDWFSAMALSLAADLMLHGGNL
jgi:hypothetical protein